jgi:cytochrome d ubiquinol oxidase subunit I
MLGMSMAAVAIVLAGITGDSSARFVYNVEPIKFAAQEGLFTTTAGAPIHIGGVPDPSAKHVLYGIEIPYALSLLAAFNPHAVVQGLDTVPPNHQPNPVIVHLSFDTMVGFGTLIGLVAAAFWLLAIKRRALPTRTRPLLWLIVATGPASVLAMEGGWFVTEFGRQPWVVHGILLTSQAATSAPGLELTLVVFVAIYLLLAVTLVRLLLRFAREPLEHR